MAILLKNAFPPIVNDAVIAVIINPMYSGLIFNLFDREEVIVTPAEPDIIPQISPITSLQKDDTLSAFFLNDTAFLAPFIFFELIACSGSSFVDVTATPIISNIIPMAINSNRIKIPINKFTFGITMLEPKENINDIKKAKNVTVTIHFVLLFLLFDIYFPFLLLKKAI